MVSVRLVVVFGLQELSDRQMCETEDIQLCINCNEARTQID